MLGKTPRFNRKLRGVAANVDFGPDYHHLYDGAGTTTLFVNGNLSPHFPHAAQIWASMWQKYSGQRVDGVIAVDPPRSAICSRRRARPLCPTPRRSVQPTPLP